jgi:hypothetical protein
MNPHKFAMNYYYGLITYNYIALMKILPYNLKIKKILYHELLFGVPPTLSDYLIMQGQNGLNSVDDNMLFCATVMAKYQDKWIFVRVKEETTWQAS